MLTAIAGSMITVAGVVFSITLVVLSQASTQYSPRVLRNFLSDRANQTVLGVFVGVFAYCLIVLRSIRGTDEGAFVPALAVLVGIVLAFAGIGFLIYFIHHVATSIQASSIMERIADETIECLSRRGIVTGDSPQCLDVAEHDAGNLVAACSSRRGYVTSIDFEALNRLAESMQCVVRVERGVGEFAIQGQPLASILDRVHVDRDWLNAVAATFEISRQRTAAVDPAFGIRQLVDVALKALSSGANDPTTASTAVDYLTAVLVEEARSAQRANGGERTTSLVQHRAATFGDLLRMSFSEIRQAAHGNLATLEAIARSLDALDAVTTRPARRRLLHAQCAALLEATKRADLPDCDLEGLRSRIGGRMVSLSRSEQ